MTLNVPTISILNMLRRTNGVTSARMNTSDARSANGSISLPGRMKASRMVIGMSSRPVDEHRGVADEQRGIHADVELAVGEPDLELLLGGVTHGNQPSISTSIILGSSTMAAAMLMASVTDLSGL